MKKISLFILQFLLLHLVVSAQSWVELGSGANALKANDIITVVAVDSAGNNVYATGRFTNSNGKYYVAKWNGSTWSELGGFNALNPNGIIKAMAVDKSGNVYVGGYFTNANGMYYISMWNGTNWSPLVGSESNGTIEAIVLDTYCNLYARVVNTETDIHKWNGSTWTNLVDRTLVTNGTPGKFLVMDGLGHFYTAGTGREIIMFRNNGWMKLSYDNSVDLANQNLKKKTNGLVNSKQ